MRVAIIGAGIVGATAAYQLTKNGATVTVFDDGRGQATKAAAGIICPWLSQRRNKDWYRLTARGAAYYPELMSQLTADGVKDLPYEQVGAYIFKKNVPLLEKLETIAYARRKEEPMIGDLEKVTPEEVAQVIPGWHGKDGAIYCSGGGRVDGKKLVQQLLEQAEHRGASIRYEHVSLHQTTNGVIGIQTAIQVEHFDKIILASGAWVKELLEPLGYEVDVRPQKGQLIELSLQTREDTSRWPVCMLHGEIDILPFAEGKIIVGATHENDKGFDLEPEEIVLEKMYDEACEIFPVLRDAPITAVRVGTRAYSSDFLPFFGSIPGCESLYVASGLGSSGLTSGVWIGELLSQLASTGNTDFDIAPYAPGSYIQTRL